MAEVRTELHRTLRWLVIATVVAYFALAAVGASVWIQADHQREATERVATSTNAALCSLRQDLEQRVASSKQFLADNPEGIPGISPALIRQNIATQERTVRALSPLEC